MKFIQANMQIQWVFRKSSLAALVFFFSLTNAWSQSSPWVILADKIDLNNYSGVTVANGMLGIISSPHPFQVKEVVLAGAYDLYGRGRVSNMVRSFSLLNMFLEVNKHRIGAGNVSNMKQELNMQLAYFKSTFDFEDKVTVSVTYRSLRHLPFTLLMDVEVTAKRDFMMRTGSVMEGPAVLKDIQNYFTEIVIPGTTMGLLTSSANSASGKLKICASNAFLFSELPGKEPDVIHEMLDDNLHQMHFSKQLRKGDVYRFSIVGSTLSSSHVNDPLNEAERLTIFASQQGHDKLVQHHEKEWSKLWQGDIEIDGDLQSQQDVRSMIYHLYSFVRPLTELSISPMGLSGTGYNGHVFWDAEIWMFPPLLVLQPELAKSMINYRFNRLDAARKNALRHGYNGAMFPWESALTGEEETPVWALSGPLEHHITACVGIAAWKYYSVTQDKLWLEEKGWPLLSATADFWVSRVQKNKSGYYEIKNVVGADEWAENIDNDAWTNGAVKANLRFADAAAVLLNKKQNPRWLTIADSIVIEKMSNGVTREHSSYHGENIKQADVNLLAYPLTEVTSDSEISNDLEYYRTRVPEQATPAMTKSIFALLYARLGEVEKAFELFQRAYLPNKLAPFGVITEMPGSYNPYFATGAGGLLQCVMMGFGGLEITDDGIIQRKMNLPGKWKSLTIKR